MTPGMIKTLYNADPLGFTAVHYAAYLGRIDFLNDVLDEGFDINAETHRGLTPLDAARIGGHVLTVAHMIRNGARTSPKNLGHDVKLAYREWLESIAPHYKAWLTKLQRAKRMESMRRKAQPPRIQPGRSKPRPSARISGVKILNRNPGSKVFNYRKWQREHADKIEMYRDKLLRQVREAYIEKLAA